MDACHVSLHLVPKKMYCIVSAQYCLLRCIHHSTIISSNELSTHPRNIFRALQVRGLFDGLLHAEVEHDLLGARGNGVGAHLAVETLHLLALTCTRIAGTTKDLQGKREELE